MYFQILKVILWPRSENPPRVLNFKTGVVNIISGASKTGKSAVIPIIDYCLGSDKCAIPVGVIRESCAWFGVLIDTLEGQKLLARREPGDQQSTGDMVLLEAAEEIRIPFRIEDKSTNVEVVKNVLNRLSNLSNLGFDPDSENRYKTRPSFRDLMAFTFQPQNIIANPDVLFFKADTTEHREKLKTIFPYILGAITAEVLQARYEMDRVSRMLRRKESELRAVTSATEAWQREAQGWLRQGVELGLLPADQTIPDDWVSIIDLLRELAMRSGHLARPSVRGIDVALKRLEELRASESSTAVRLGEVRRRLNEIRRLQESSDAYGGAMRIQRDRLAIAEWLRGISADNIEDPLTKLSVDDGDRIESLCRILSEVEVKLRTQPTLSETLGKEAVRLRSAAEETVGILNSVRNEISTLEQASEEARKASNEFDRVERFLGRLEQAISLYDRADQSSSLRDEISRLRAEMDQYQKIISESDIRRKLENTLSRVESIAFQFVPHLDAEWPDAPIRLKIEELTIKVVRGSRDDYLWEIGSGANWLAYHVAITLALQRFFMSEPNHHVPALLVYDQPSQVYFPKRLAHDDEEDDTEIRWRDQDVIAVRKIFMLLGTEVRAAGGRLQVIVLDHADEGVWGGIEGVVRSEEWRGSALVPSEWIGR